MSTVRPFTSNCTGGGGAFSTLLLSACLAVAGLAGAGAAARRTARDADGAQIHQPGVGRQRAGHFVEHVRPDVAVAVDGADDADLRHQRVPDRLLVALLRQERLEALVLGPALLELRRERAQLARGAEEDEAQIPEHAHPAQDGHEQHGVLDPAPQAAHPIERPREGPPRALALEVGAEIDGDHRSSVLVGVTRRCAARGRSGASAGARPRRPGTGRRRHPPPGASRSDWPAGPECAAGPRALC